MLSSQERWNTHYHTQVLKLWQELIFINYLGNCRSKVKNWKARRWGKSMEDQYYQVFVMNALSGQFTDMYFFQPTVLYQFSSQMKRQALGIWNGIWKYKNYLQKLFFSVNLWAATSIEVAVHLALWNTIHAP